MTAQLRLRLPLVLPFHRHSLIFDAHNRIVWHFIPEGPVTTVNVHGWGTNVEVMWLTMKDHDLPFAP